MKFLRIRKSNIGENVRSLEKYFKGRERYIDPGIIWVGRRLGKFTLEFTNKTSVGLSISEVVANVFVDEFWVEN